LKSFGQGWKRFHGGFSAEVPDLIGLPQPSKLISTRPKDYLSPCTGDILNPLIKTPEYRSSALYSATASVPQGRRISYFLRREHQIVSGNPRQAGHYPELKGLDDQV